MTADDEYARDVRQERLLFAWVMGRHGGLSDEDARRAAVAAYPYRPDDPWRDLVFHDEAWHWAMLVLHGDGYWRSRPDLERPSAEYDRAARAIADGDREFDGAVADDGPR